jgi:DNA repair exonuclease SbcCD ATPase subunit
MIFLKRLGIEGYRSYGEKQYIDLATPGVVLVTGDNQDRGDSQAAGKSTMFKGLQTILFQENDDGSIKDHGINALQKKKGCLLDLEFDIDGKPYYSMYARKHPEMGTEWGFWRWDADKWTDLRGERFDDTGKTIQNAIGMSSRDFVSVAYIQQSTIAEFISCTPGERETVFANILGIHSLESFRKRIRNDIKYWKLQAQQNDQKVGVLEDTLRNAQYELDNIEYPITKQKLVSEVLSIIKSNSSISGVTWHTVIETTLNNCAPCQLTILRGEHQSLTSSIDENRKKVELAGPYIQLSERIQILQGEFESVDAQYQSAYKSYDKEAGGRYENAQNSVDHFSTQVGICQSQLQTKRGRLDRLACSNNIVCEDCKQDLSSELREFLVGELRRKISEEEASLTQWSEGLTENQRVLAQARRESTSATSTFGVMSKLLRQRSDTHEKLQKALSQLEDIKKVVGDAPDFVVEEVPRLQAEIDRAIGRRDEVTQLITKMEGMVDKVTSLDARFQKAHTDIEALQKENLTHAASVTHLKACDDIVAGFKTYRIDSSRELFNTSLARYLGIMTDGDIEAELVTEVAKAKGKDTKSEVDIIVKEGDKQGVSIRHYSGGEKTTLSLAITGAFWDLANLQSNNSVNILLLDEPFGAVDRYSEEKACQFLGHLKSLGRTVFVITNRNSVRDSGVFDREIRAVKKNHITHLEFYDLQGEH